MNKAIEAYDAVCVALEKLHDLNEVDAKHVGAVLAGWTDSRPPTYNAVAQKLIPFLNRPRDLKSIGVRTLR